jgi:hypothetical protein
MPELWVKFGENTPEFLTAKAHEGKGKVVTRFPRAGRLSPAFVVFEGESAQKAGSYRSFPAIGLLRCFFLYILVQSTV